MMANISIRRLTKELQNITNEPIEGILIDPPVDIYIWNATISGPKDTPYENGIFNILLRFDDSYPYKPPSVKFLNPIFHPNIYRDGKICVDILQSSDWCASLNIRTILLSIISLLNDPNPASPANREAAILYEKDRSAYNEKVKELISKK
jgi:ubiquitin-conjugating enzyme E2 A